MIPRRPGPSISPGSPVRAPVRAGPRRAILSSGADEPEEDRLADQPRRNWSRLFGGVAVGVGLGLAYSFVSRALGSG